MSSSFAPIRTALGLAALLGGLGLSGSAWAQEKGLPECPKDRSLRWHNCFGSLVLPNGAKYVGEFNYGNREGRGTQTWPDGEKYVGEWRSDKYNGKGILYGPNGSVYLMGYWEDNRLTQPANISPSGLRPPPPSPTIAATPPPLASPPVAATPSPPAAPKASSGTGFRIAAGQFVTNHHVINGCNWLTVNGKLGGRLLASDQTRDLALVSISNDSGPIASIRTTRIQLNESITAAGFPLEGAFSGIAITNGTISRLSGLRGDTGEVQISAPVQPGNSGGPLLDTAGNVIGVVSSKLNALKMAGVSGDIPQNVNFAINGSSLRAFLDAKNINYKEVGNESELTGVQIAARASAFTVLIECQR